MNTEPSRLTIEKSAPRTLAAKGVIDTHTSDILTEHVDRLGRTADVEIRLADIEFIDSSGLRAIVAAHQQLGLAGHKLVLSGVSDAVTRLLEISGLRDHLHIV